MGKREITPADILPPDVYARRRDELRRRITAIKKNRRVSVGPDVTVYFESYDTMLQQVQEMLHIEGGGAAQIADELSAYNPLIPDGSHLVATMMIEIDDPGRRARVLAALGGIEETVTLVFDAREVAAVPEADVERTTADGKTSSVHFLKFPFAADDIAAFRRPGTRVVLAVRHPAYDHMAALAEDTRAALAGDFD